MTEEIKDNRLMVDNNTAQKITAAEIDQMKRENVDGQQIINALIQNSESFQARTAFSQAKYLKKKQQKYAVWFECRRPTSLNLCEVYHKTSPDKICYLRPDSLALLLNMANLSFTSRVLLIENTKGFLSGALLERCVAYVLRVEFHEKLADFGTLSASGHNTMGGLQPKMQILREFNFHSKHTRRVGYINASLLMNGANSTDILAK